MCLLVWFRSIDKKNQFHLHSCKHCSPMCWFESCVFFCIISWVLLYNCAGKNKNKTAVCIFVAAICSSCTKCDKSKHVFHGLGQSACSSALSPPCWGKASQRWSCGRYPLIYRSFWADGVLELPAENPGFSQQNLFYCGRSGRCQAFEAANKVGKDDDDDLKQGWKITKWYLYWPV